jgi:hypothetical protein
MGGRMKIRATTELVDFLGAKKQVRKRELISLSQALALPRRKAVGLICRSAVVFAYAHWEGFVKEAARAYVYLVAHKSHRLDALSLNFQALVCRQEILSAQTATRRIRPHISLARRFTEGISRGCTIDADAAIDTESNLTAAVFENICLSVGLDYHRAWATQGPFMDDLFRSRCAIAHGELSTPDSRYAKESVEFSIGAIDRFSTDIENAAVLESYLRST